MQMHMTVSTVAQMTTTNAAVTAESCQLLPRILMTAQTAMIGDLMSICRPRARIIWIWVISLVVRVIRLGMESDCISSVPRSMTWWNSFARTVKLKPEAVRAAKKPQAMASSALARVQPSIRRPTDVISAVVEPAVLMSFVSSVI